MSENKPQIDLTKIHTKRQKLWEDKNVYKTKEYPNKEKFYILDMFPYPSGAGLHVWHPKGYIATDVIARKKMLEWFSVLHPMWFDTFWLWTENYAIKHQVKPQDAAKKNITRYIEQLKMFGCTYDWDRSFSTAEPDYYKRTQSIFLKLYEHYYDYNKKKARPIYELQEKDEDIINSKRLAYVDFKPINRCPSCKTALANEDLEEWRCERCNSEIEQKPMKQRVLRITDYAERLLDGLETLDQRTKSDKEMQKNRIGKSQWTELSFDVIDWWKISAYTTRIDTIFGATFLVLAPEHPLVDRITTTEKKQAILDYQEQSKKKSQLERTELQKDKTWVFTWAYAINPFNKNKIQIRIADYVMMGYWTGAIMAVPWHDERDEEFAQKYNLPIIIVVSSKWKLVNSWEYSDLTIMQATEKMQKFLKKNKIWSKKDQYRLQDRVFSRQRYRGEPIPMIWIREDETQDYTKLQSLSDADFPLKLPEIESYAPTGTEEWPLSNVEDRAYGVLQDGRKFRRETNTMPWWAGSSRYRLRYMDPKNSSELVSKENEKYRKNVDIYVWWAEHVTRHMIYARFRQKFLFDIWIVTQEEPFLKYQKVWLIMAEDGRKMSKRRWNVINPDDVIKEFWNDTLRVYEMFIGPFDQSVARNTNWLKWVKKFLNKIIKLSENILDHKNTDPQSRKPLDTIINKTIKKVTEDIDKFWFNTAISQLMVCVNTLLENGWVDKQSFEKLLLLLAPFAPHLAEELRERLWNHNMIFELKKNRPQYDPNLIIEDTISLPVQFSGKMRWTIDIPKSITQDDIIKLIKSDTKLSKYRTGTPKKIIYVPWKITNIII